MRRVSKVVAVSVAVVCLAVPSFAGVAGKPAAKKKLNPIVQLFHKLASRVFDGGDMSVPKP
jgi:hypothetical protein